MTPAEVQAGDNIRQWRQLRALELRDLARLANMSPERLSGIEAGEPGLLCLDDLDRLAAALAVRPATLFLAPGSETVAPPIKT